MSSIFTLIKIIQLKKNCWLNIRKERGIFSVKEANWKGKRSFFGEGQAYSIFNIDLLLHIFQEFIYKRKIIGAYKEWRSESQLFKKKKRSLLSLVLRKEAKNKIHVMNEFRKCVQYY